MLAGASECQRSYRWGGGAGMQAEVHEGGGGCEKLLGIVDPSRSAKEHATERGCRGHTYIWYLKT